MVLRLAILLNFFMLDYNGTYPLQSDRLNADVGSESMKILVPVDGVVRTCHKMGYNNAHGPDDIPNVAFKNAIHVHHAVFANL